MAMLKEHDQTGLALKTLYPITTERAPEELAFFLFSCDENVMNIFTLD